MTTQEKLLDEASQWVRRELAALLGPEYQIVRITTDTFRHEDEDLNNIHVYFKSGHPRLDAYALLQLHSRAYDTFAARGMESPPTIFYGQEAAIQ